MNYEVILTESAEIEINKKLEKHIRARLYKKLQKLKEYPTIYGKPLRRPLAGVWQLRFERRYRILYTIDEENKIVHIKGLKHKDEMKKLTII